MAILGVHLNGASSFPALNLPPVFHGSDYQVEEAFPSLPDLFCTTIASPPGETNRLFLTTQDGLIYAVTNLAAPSLSVFMDLRKGLYSEFEAGLLGLAFHPDFARNGHFFVFYTPAMPADSGYVCLDRLSRFTVDPGNPNHASVESEVRLFSQPDRHGFHNGGDLHFGPDGYLYVGVGDEGGAYGEFGNAQKIDGGLFSGILRLDVDRRPGSLDPNPGVAVHPGAYAIPPDNPFVGMAHYGVGGNPVFDAEPATPRLRTEFYAIGFRNPWRFSFDRVTGALWANDVGQNRRDEVNLVVPGGNYGWNVLEGSLLANPAYTRDGFTDPVFEYEHDGARYAITGSLFYRGGRYPELDGLYLFTDFNGEMGLVEKRAGLWQGRWFASVPGGAITMGENPSTGDILISGNLGRIWKLVGIPGSETPLPDRLSATGVFSDIATLQPAPGLIPYSINHPFWSDHASKRRWVSIPDPTETFGFSENGPWRLPSRVVWVKHFDMELGGGALRRIETRILVKSGDGFYGATYRWAPDQKDASLVPPEGADDIVLVPEGNAIRLQRWRFPSQAECRACHTPLAGVALGFNTRQLNRTGVEALWEGENQISWMDGHGYLTGVTGLEFSWPRLAAADDASASVEFRVRSYLDANCSQCHQPSAPNRATWDARFQIPMDGKNLIGQEPINNLEMPGALLVVPGKSADSILYLRLSDMGPQHMPPLATSVRNEVGTALVRSWIDEALKQGADDQGGTSPFPVDHWYLRSSINAGTMILEFPQLAGFRTILEETSGLLMNSGWRVVDDPVNRMKFPSSDVPVSARFPLAGESRFFRFRFERP